MLDFLRDMSSEEKHILVKRLEELVGDTDTDALKAYTKDKTNKEKLLNCIYNFLSDRFDYNATKPRSHQDEEGGLEKFAAAALT